MLLVETATASHLFNHATNRNWSLTLMASFGISHTRDASFGISHTRDVVIISHTRDVVIVPMEIYIH